MLDSRHCVFSSGFCDDRNRHRAEPWKESPTHTPLPRGLLGETREGADVVARKRSFAAGVFLFLRPSARLISAADAPHARACYCCFNLSCSLFFCS